jgi:hypothetical protein
MSAFIYAWGQFLDHDLDLTPNAAPGQSFNVQVPLGDPSFDPKSTGTQVIPLNRSQFDPATGTSAANPRQQQNVITAWIDGSVRWLEAARRRLTIFIGGKMRLRRRHAAFNTLACQPTMLTSFRTTSSSWAGMSGRMRTSS